PVFRDRRRAPAPRPGCGRCHRVEHDPQRAAWQPRVRLAAGPAAAGRGLAVGADGYRRPAFPGHLRRAIARRPFLRCARSRGQPAGGGDRCKNGRFVLARRRCAEPQARAVPGQARRRNGDGHRRDRTAAARWRTRESAARPADALATGGRSHAAEVDAAAHVRQLTSVVHGVDPQAAVTAVHTQARAMEMARLNLMILTELFGALGLIALLLAAAGLYGVLSFSVTQRTREIGIRRAIGAGHGAILRDTGRQLGWQLGIGLFIGFGLALPWSQLLADPNLHTRAHDPAVFVPVLLVVVAAAVLAALVPVLRALRIAPAVALRYA